MHFRLAINNKSLIRQLYVTVSARLHHRETKSVENVSQECIVHSWESKEAENAADEIIRKPKVHNSEHF